MLALAPSASLLDVGCGTGTWMRAALEYGLQDVLGVDGVHPPAAQLHVPPTLVCSADLTRPWSADRRFDLTLCLEVAEHLDPGAADTLLDTLISHSDRIFFSAACPGQPGQHHVNCQWPAYWQERFNHRGYVCTDAVRWQIWDLPSVDPWYRQNLFLATRDPAIAGNETRIRPIIHPEMLASLSSSSDFQVSTAVTRAIESGSMPVSWYLSAPLTALMRKTTRFFTS